MRLFVFFQANHVAEAAVYEASEQQATGRHTSTGGGGGKGRGSIRVRAESSGVVYAVPMGIYANSQHQTQTHNPTAPIPGYLTVGRATAVVRTDETFA